MRIDTLDYKEFENGDAGESLAIASEHLKYHEAILGFVEATSKYEEFEKIYNLPVIAEFESKVINQMMIPSKLISHFKDLCNVSCIGNEKCLVLTEEWNEQDYILEIEHRYYRYLWSTSA